MFARRPTALLCAWLVLFAPAIVQADTPAPWPEVTFKRVKPPVAGATKRITVQITELPAPPVSRVALSEPAAPQTPEVQGPVSPRTGFEWYWDAVSPSLASRGPARVARALQVIASPPADAAVSTPRLQNLQTIADAHGVDILTATIGTQVSPALVLAMISVESSGRTEVVSSAGATGLMQLMPATADRFGVDDVRHPAENIRGGVAYMDWLLREFDGDAVLALAGYNAGENAVKSHDGVPPYAETRAYVPKVMAAWTVARGLCLTPPELLSDPCVLVRRQAASNG